MVEFSLFFPYTKAIMKYIAFWQNLSPWARVMGGFLSSSFLLLMLTLFGGMYTLPILLSLLPLALSVGNALIHLFLKRDWLRIGIITVLTLGAWYNLTGEIPSIFTGRDQGSIAEATWQLAHHHQLTWTNASIQTFFTIYGPGTALNFPGFAYTDSGSLITQFPLGYTAWLAGFVEWLGLAGYHVANGLLFLLTGWTFFELLRVFVRRTLAFIGTLIVSFSFLPIWMLHSTLTENMAIVLFTALAYALIQLRQHPHERLWYIISISAASLFLFVRIEGFLFFGITVLLIACTKTLRTFLWEHPWKRVFLPLLFLGFLFLRDFFINLPFYKMIGKAVLKNWQELIVTASGAALSSTSTTTENLFRIFTSYGLILFFLVGSVGIILTLWRGHRLAQLVFLLALPTFVYLIDGHITPDHPWMLRRYFFTLWPTFVFFSILAWHMAEKNFEYIRRPQTTLFIFLFVFLVQYPSLQAAWKTDEYTALYTATQSVADRVSGDDLLLVNRLASGDPFRLVAGPLAFVFEKQAVYFFNPEDLDRLPAKNNFRRVLLLVPEETKGLIQNTWGDRLIEKAVFSFPQSTTTAQQTFIPQITKSTTRAYLFEIKF